MSDFRFASAVTDAATRLQLTPAQRRVLAVEPGFSVQVTGPPGSGKTTALIELVAHRVLQQAMGTDELLVLAPNRAGATALRDRVALRLGVPSNGPLVRSVGSYAFAVVSVAQSAAGELPPRLMTGSLQDQILAELLAGQQEDGTGTAWPERLGPELRALPAFRTELRELMMRATQLGIDPARLAALGAGERPEWTAAAALFQEYAAVVESLDPGYRDAAELLANAAGVVSVQGQPGVKLVIVEDAQELTVGEQRLLSALAGRGIPVIAFGTPDLSTGAYRGARPETLSALPRLLGPAARLVPPIVLDRVHRGAGQAARLTASIAEHIGVAGMPQQRLPAARLQDGRSRVRAVRAPSADQEHAVVARALREAHLRRSVPWEQMAVVVRSQQLIPAFTRALTLAEVPTRTASGGLALRDELAAGQLARIAAVGLGVQQLDQALAIELLTGPFGGLDAIGLRRLRLAIRQEELAGEGSRPSGLLLVEALLAPGGFATIDTAEARRAGRLSAAFELVRVGALEEASAEELLWAVWEHSRLAGTWQQQSLAGGILGAEADRQLDGVVALFSSAKRFVERFPGSPAAPFFEQLLTSPLPEDTLAPAAQAHAVTVTTPNGVVGAEFEVVVLAGLQEGGWPNPRIRGTLLHLDELEPRLHGVPAEAKDARREALEGELRMAALAVSRARSEVLLTAVDDEEQQPSALLRLAEGLLEDEGEESPQQEDARQRTPLNLRGLVGALRGRLVRSLEQGTQTGEAALAGRAEHAAAASALARLARERVPGADPGQWYGILEPSVTGPLHEFGPPDAPEPMPVSPSAMEKFETSPMVWFIDRVAGGSAGMPAAVGTLLHAAMEAVAEEPELAEDEERLWGRVEQRWQELHFDSEWLAELEQRKARRKLAGLAAYLREFAAGGSRLLAAELGFALELGTARIRGIIDRVELADGSVVVTDLKTGNTMASKEEAKQHAQLQSYQLAVSEGALAEQLAEQFGDAPLAGAQLLYVAVPGNKAPYVTRTQAPLDVEQRSAFIERVQKAAAGMASGDYPAETALPYASPYDSYLYRIQIVEEVSA